MMRLLNIGRTVTFLVMVLSSIPMFVNFLTGREPERQLIVNLHVWFGLAFIIFAVISMVIQKKNAK